MSDLRIVLASASPRRLQLLRAVGLDPEVRPAALDERPHAGEAPDDTVIRLATLKARHVAATAPAEAVVVAADTEVVLDGEVLGKPTDDRDARRMLRLLSGREHVVLTGICAWHCRSGASAAEVVSTRVRFRPLDDREVEWYVRSGEPRDKAGAYGIQARGALLVASISGSWSSVVGLPLESLPELLRRVGVDLFDP